MLYNVWYLLSFVILSIGFISSQLTGYEANKITEKHNELRRLAGASNMIMFKYNQSLANLANKWATNCTFKHPDRDVNTEYEGISENLAYSTYPDATAMTAVKDWFDEIKDYKQDKCLPGKVCGHYTLIVWAKVQSLGCASTQVCPNLGRYTVCQYYPQGNFFRQKPFLKGNPCSACPTTHTYCVEGLCSDETQVPNTTTKQTTGAKGISSARQTTKNVPDRRNTSPVNSKRHNIPFEPLKTISGKRTALPVNSTPNIVRRKTTKNAPGKRSTSSVNTKPYIIHTKPANFFSTISTLGSKKLDPNLNHINSTEDINVLLITFLVFEFLLFFIATYIILYVVVAHMEASH